MKFVALVNGVPASGKSTVARELSRRTGWPLYGLDTLKEALFAHLGTGDRAHNRRFGQASYRAIFALIGDCPDGCAAVVDAWFGFQPEDVLHAHLARAGIANAAQIWCAAPPETIGARYLARLKDRAPGHLGAEYAPELVALAARAKPLAGFATLTLDTSAPTDTSQAAKWLMARREERTPTRAG